MCIYVCLHVHTCTYVYIYMYMYICVHVYTYVQIHTYIYAYVCICAHVCTHVQAHWLLAIVYMCLDNFLAACRPIQRRGGVPHAPHACIYYSYRKVLTKHGSLPTCAHAISA